MKQRRTQRTSKRPRNPQTAKPELPQITALVAIEKPIYGGAFLARVDGKAVFVPLTLPGEQARVRITEDKRGYATAEVDEIVTRSPRTHCTRLPPLRRLRRLQLSTRGLSRHKSLSSKPSCAKRSSAAA